MKNPKNNRNVTKGEVFKFEVYLAVKDIFDEKTADDIANSIFDEFVVKRKGKITIEEFKEVIKSIVPSCEAKEEAMEELMEQFDICTSGACINQCYLRPNEAGYEIIP